MTQMMQMTQDQGITALHSVALEKCSWASTQIRPDVASQRPKYVYKSFIDLHWLMASGLNPFV